jgi:hypothetical protein
MMNFNLAQATIFLMSPASSAAVAAVAVTKTPAATVNNQAQSDLLTLDMNNERSINILETSGAMRNFFLQVDNIFYERHEKNKLEYTNTATNRLVSNRKYSSYMRNMKRSFKNHNSSKNKNSSFDEDLDLLKRKSKYFDFTNNNNNNNNKNMSSSSLNQVTSMTSLIPFQVKNMPKHNLLVRNLKAKWNNVNRDVLHTLYEIYSKSKLLRHNVSSQALKQFDMLTGEMLENLTDAAVSNLTSY